jgi:hypothetical protein
VIESGEFPRSAAVITSHALPAVTAPNSNILGKGKKSHYILKKLTVAEDTSGNNCSTGFVSFTITNQGTATQYLTFETSPGVFSAFGPLAGKAVSPVCVADGTAGEKLVFGLSNSADTENYKSKLKVTLSD